MNNEIPKFKAELIVDPKVLANMQKCLDEPTPDSGKGEVIFDREVTFENGIRMAVQVVCSLSPLTESAWSQGVLYDPDGNECGCTDCGESLEGEFYCEIVGADPYEGEYYCEVKTRSSATGDENVKG